MDGCIYGCMYIYMYVCMSIDDVPSHSLLVLLSYLCVCIYIFHLPICVSIGLSLSLSIYLSIYLSALHSFIILSLSRSLSLSLYLPITHLSSSLSLYIYVHPCANRIPTTTLGGGDTTDRPTEQRHQGDGEHDGAVMMNDR
eukprot:GHVU01142469.1.p3 GENE.GHVU01142469.1~~GHVU01142469.1.p3  ORF type:complete len:141 (+),score=6.80 GHVU01142469.1:45-467(+)